MLMISVFAICWGLDRFALQSGEFPDILINTTSLRSGELHALGIMCGQLSGVLNMQASTMQQSLQTALKGKSGSHPVRSDVVIPKE